MKPYISACSVLLRVARKLFDLSMSVELPAPDSVEALALEHWYTLRKISALWLRDRSTALDTPLRESMVGALRFAHELEHNAPFIPKIEHCSCEMAGWLRDLALLQVADATGVEIPGVAA